MLELKSKIAFEKHLKNCSEYQISKGHLLKLHLKHTNKQTVLENIYLHSSFSSLQILRKSVNDEKQGWKITLYETVLLYVTISL